MNTKRLLNMSAMLVLITAFLLAFTEGGVFAVQKYLQPKNEFAGGTTIGGIEFAGKTKNEAQQELVKAVGEWQSKSQLDVRFAEDNQPADLGALSFAIAKSVQTAESGKSNPIIIEMTESEAEEMVFSLYPGADPSAFDLSGLRRAIIGKAANLDKPLQDAIHLNEFFLDDNGEETIAEVFANGGDITPGVASLTGVMSDVPIEGKSTFSLLEFAANLGMDELDSEDASVVASLLYELLFQTNFTIMERNQSSELPDYAQLGLEAKVDGKANLDFIFANPNEEPYKLSVTEEDGGLRAVLTGNPFVYGYELSLQNRKKFAPKTIQQYSPSLAKGETRIAEKGQDGLLISAFRLKKNHDREVLDEEQIAEDFYPPIHRVVMRSLIIKESEAATEDENVINGEDFRGDEQKPDTDGNKGDSGNAGSGKTDQKDQGNSGTAPEKSSGGITKPSGGKDDNPDSGDGKGNASSGQGQAGGQDKSDTAVPGQVWTDPGDVKK